MKFTNVALDLVHHVEFSNYLVISPLQFYLAGSGWGKRLDFPSQRATSATSFLFFLFFFTRPTITDNNKNLNLGRSLAGEPVLGALRF